MPDDGAPWDQPEWRGETEAWIDAQLAAIGDDRTGDIEEIRLSTISGVLFAPTTGGGVVYKQVPALFGAEGAMLQLLDRLVPGSVPRPLVVDETGHRCLMARLPVAGEAFQKGAGVEALVRLAALQQATVGRGDEVLATGCPDRRLQHLHRDVLALAEREDLLAPETRAALCLALPEVTDRIDRLATMGFPETIVHGDLHPWNAVVTDAGEVVLFDWTDAALGHPLLDLDVWLRRVDDPDAQADRYFATWVDVAPVEELRAAWEWVASLSGLYAAVSYQRIVDGIERESWQGAVGKWVERALSLASDDG